MPLTPPLLRLIMDQRYHSTSASQADLTPESIATEYLRPRQLSTDDIQTPQPQQRMNSFNLVASSFTGMDFVCNTPGSKPSGSLAHMFPPVMAMSPLHDVDCMPDSLAATPAQGVGVVSSGESEPWKESSRDHSERASFRLPSAAIQLDAGDFDINDRPFEAVAGGGRSSTVRFAKRVTDDLPVALKYLKPGMVDEVRRELTVLEMTSTMDRVDGLVRGLGFYRDAETLSIVVVMERMAGSLLNFCGQPMPEEVATAALAMTLQGLTTLHDRLSVIHRDIKPSNLLFDRQGAVKIADFGMSVTALRDGSAKLFVGSIRYMAPERLRGESYDFDSDLWSLGMVTAELLFGAYPLAFAFASEDSEASAEATFWAIAEVLKHADGDDSKPEEAIRAHVLEPLRTKGVSAGLIHLLSRMMCGRSQRLSAAQAHAELFSLTRRTVQQHADIFRRYIGA